MEAKRDDTLFYNHSIDVSQYWRAVTRNKWAILAFAIVMSFVVSLFVLAMTPLYQSSTTLLIETERTNVMSIEEVYGFDSSRREYYLTQYEILRSRQIAERVVKRLNLTTHPLFDYEQLAQNQSGLASSISSIKKLVKTAIPLFPDPQEVVLTDAEKQQNKLDFAIAKLQANIDIKPVFHTHVVEIEFVSEDPLLAATISDTVANVYIENYLEAKLEMTAKATTWLNTSLAGLKNNLIKSEQALNAFYEKEKLVNIDGVIGLASEELQRYTALFVDAQNNLARVRSIFEQVNGQASKQDLASLQDVQNHPTVQNVKKQQLNAQSRVSELAKVYGPRHPKMIAANAELESIDDSLARQVRALVDGIYQEYQAAESKVNSLKVEVESAKQNYRKLSNLENQHLALQREVEINNQLYSSFFTRLKETNEIGGFERANARILDAAKPALVPFKPRKAMLILLAFVASLLLAISAAIIKDTLNRGIRSVEDVERKLNQKMLGLLPLEKVKRKSSLPVRYFFADEHHVFSEAIRTLRTSLQFTNLEKSSQTMLVTSSVPKEGKSTVAINLGFAFSQLAMVLLIDADMRRPSIGKQFNLAGFQPGLSNLIAKTHELSECLCIDEESGLHILPAGTIPPNPQELLSSERFTRIMSVLKQKYQYIIIDSAPTQAVSDAMVLAKTADSIVYVVKANDTDEGLINNGISRFLMNGKRVDGVVLNQVDIHRADKYGEFAGYYDRYDYQS
jgi:succinoglycan biosynthesis transport protein ExoP